RYMTETGTVRLEELEFFPCACPKCSSKNPRDVAEFSNKERQVFIAEHNLYVCSAEIKRIKQAIKEGRLWEHLELRAHGHPALLQALKKLKKYEKFIEKHSPTIKRSGLFYFDSAGLIRPEVVRHKIRLSERYAPPKETEVLILMPQTRTKPYHKSEEYKRLVKALQDFPKERLHKLHICFYEAPFGVIPLELDEVYPLSQHETTMPMDKETVEYVASEVADYISRNNYKLVLMLYIAEDWGAEVLKACKKACAAKSVAFKSFSMDRRWVKSMSKFLIKMKID
ncbi:MAG: DUF5591 domain-containing protein, partial [Candidatus Bathyarchaeia archaeon]